MTKAIIPPHMIDLEQEWHMSPGIISGDHVFLTGFNGCPLDGPPPDDAGAQIDIAFKTVAEVLEHAGLGMHDIVDMTSFHVGLQSHLALFKRKRADHLTRPYPAWTAIEVAGFATPGVIVELKVVARLPTV